jgi:hypothetical protein
MGKYIAGDNLKGWASYARKNSYHADKAKLMDQLNGAGTGDRINDCIPNNEDWREPQKKSEGSGWAEISEAAKPNTYTGKGGSKREG